MSYAISFLSAVLNFLYVLTRPIYKYYFNVNGVKSRTVPPIKDDLLKLSASELADKIRNKQLSSEEICQAYIKRVKAVNPVLNAVVQERFAEALKEARNVDNYLTTSSLNSDDLKKIKPLLGVPVTLKESCSLKGYSSCVGSRTRAGFKADHDGEVVARLKTSGAIPLLISTTPELCLSWETHNLVTGTTNNPYNTSHSAAGSSGGEGALLGAGASVIGIGSDIAGSIRLPALYNGVFGHKPTARVVPIKGHLPLIREDEWSKYLVLGPMTRYAKDLRLVLKVISGKNASLLKLNEDVDLSKLTIYYMVDAGKETSFTIADVDDEIKDKIRESVVYLEQSYGCRVVRDYKFDFSEINNLASVLYCNEDVPDVLKPEKNNLAVEMIKSLFGQSRFSFNILFFYLQQFIFKNTTSSDLVKLNKIKDHFETKLGENAILICPTWHTAALKHYQFYFCMPSVSFMFFSNLFGLPATHVPCGLNSEGLPIGVQVVAGPLQDRLCLAVAEALEKRFGGWIPPQ